MSAVDLHKAREHNGSDSTHHPAKVAAIGPRRKSRRRIILAIARSTVIVAAIGLAVVIPLGWGHWLAGLTDQSTDDAYLKADTAAIGTEVAGRIDRVVVADFQAVRAGDILALIDDRDYRIQLTRAQAGVEAAAAAIRTLESQIALQAKVIAQAEAAVKAVMADMARAESEHSRQQVASLSGWSTVQKLEAATADMRRYEAQLEEKKSGVDVERQKVNLLKAQLEQAGAELDNQHAGFAAACRNLEKASIVAPFDGVVSASNVRAGQYVGIGTKVISVVPLQHLYVSANFKETQLGKVRPGQSVTMTVDMFPGRQLTGHVGRISPASGSEFALLPPDNATGNFTKVAQRVAIRIELDDTTDLGGLLRPGMSVVPTIHTDSGAKGKTEGQK